MAVVEMKTATEPPTEATASRDAIDALLNRLCADVMTEIEHAERALRSFSELALSNTASIKAQLANMVDCAGAIKKEARRVEETLDTLRADHARLVGSGRGET
jgi:hypothetical protein